MENQPKTELCTYADMWRYTDNANPSDVECVEDWDNYYCLTFAVPTDWLANMVSEHWGDSLDSFFDYYTWEDTSVVFEEAIENKIISDIELCR